jgi:carboxymethylenebutenolidase
MPPRSAPRWPRAADVVRLSFLGALLLTLAPVMYCQSPPAAGSGRPVLPFLVEFRAHTPPTVVTREDMIPSAVGQVRGYLARPETTERLPAVLLLPDEQGLTPWMKENARDLAGIGYVVLAADLGAGSSTPQAQTRGVSAALADEQTLAKLSAMVRWLHRRGDVLPGRLGVVGWLSGADQALALAATTPLQACVACDAVVTDNPILMAGLRGTAVLTVFAGDAGDPSKAIPAFHKALANARAPHKLRVFDGVGLGFMGPEDRKSYARAAADKAWFEIYEFLGKYVEDPPQPAAAEVPTESIHPRTSVATIADIMRSVNQPTAVRGTLIRLLEQEPTKQRQWENVRANAALMAEANRLLKSSTPKRGTRDHWLEEVEAFTAALEGIVAAADKHDYAGARRGLEEIKDRCAACHAAHR